MNTNEMTRASINEADIKEWLNARDLELRALPGAPKDAHVLLWVRSWDATKFAVLISGEGLSDMSAETFAAAKAKFLATITTPEQQAHKLRTEAQALIAKAVEIEEALTSTETP